MTRCAYIRRSVFVRYARKDCISLSKTIDNWTFWQRIRLNDKLIAEMAPVMKEACTDASNPEKMLRTASHS
jgi:hypothetical protein